MAEPTGRNTPQLERWKGQFGDAYIDANPPTAETVATTARYFARILSECVPGPHSIVEVGANVGINVQALSRVTTAEMTAVEPNAKARDSLLRSAILPPDRVLDGQIEALPLPDASADLVFTRGVLIHLAEPALERGCRELHRVSRRFILSIEYFAPSTQVIPYRGHDDMLFKRDYGSVWLDLFPSLQYVADGFLWDRTTGGGNCNWWLFRKTDQPGQR